MAMTLVKAKGSVKVTETAKKWAMENANVVFAANGEGMGMDFSVMSFHKNYSSYSKFVDDLKTQLADNLQDLQTFLMATGKERTLKPLSLKYLEKAAEE